MVVALLVKLVALLWRTNAMWLVSPPPATRKTLNVAVFPMAAAVPSIVALARPVKPVAPMCPINVVKDPVCPPPAPPKVHNAAVSPTAAAAPSIVVNVVQVRFVAR